MSKIIIHNGRCGSTFVYLCMDRYYRAAQGDNSLGNFMSIYERTYDLDNCTYVGLNDFLEPDLVKIIYCNDTLITQPPARIGARGTEIIRGPLHNVLLAPTRNTREKETRILLLKKLLNSHSILLKYPLINNTKINFDADYISCERRDVRAQTRSLYLSTTTGYYHFGVDDENKIKKLSKFAPNDETLERWLYDVKASWKKYSKIKPKKCQTIFMEDFENLQPYEILELVGLNDWHKYLDKSFKVPIRKGWSSI